MHAWLYVVHKQRGFTALHTACRRTDITTRDRIIPLMRGGADMHIRNKVCAGVGVGSLPQKSTEHGGGCAFVKLTAWNEESVYCSCSTHTAPVVSFFSITHYLSMYFLILGCVLFSQRGELCTELPTSRNQSSWSNDALRQLLSNLEVSDDLCER